MLSFATYSVCAARERLLELALGAGRRPCSLSRSHAGSRECRSQTAGSAYSLAFERERWCGGSFALSYRAVEYIASSLIPLYTPPYSDKTTLDAKAEGSFRGRVRQELGVPPHERARRRAGQFSSVSVSYPVVLLHGGLCGGIRERTKFSILITTRRRNTAPTRADARAWRLRAGTPRPRARRSRHRPRRSAGPCPTRTRAPSPRLTPAPTIHGASLL